MIRSCRGRSFMLVLTPGMDAFDTELSNRDAEPNDETTQPAVSC
jgi:hypothetical protein